MHKHRFGIKVHVFVILIHETTKCDVMLTKYFSSEVFVPFVKHESRPHYFEFLFWN